MEHIILGLLWIAFCFLHSLLAGKKLKDKLRVKMGAGFRYYRLIYTLFAFLSFGYVLFYGMTMDQVLLFELTGIIFFSGLLLSFSGLVLMVICISKYFVGLSGIRSLVREESSSQLIITGVHRFVRHPLYLGTFVFIWGLFLLLPYLSLLISNVIITVYTLIGISFEESKLIDEFGDDYHHYRRTVPRILPFRFRKPSTPMES